MKTIHIGLAAMAAVVLMTASAAGAKPIDKAVGDKIIADVRATEHRWNQDILTRDATKFASYYDADATFMNPGLAPIHGRAAIEAAMKQVFADPDFTLMFAADTVSVSGDGDTAYSQGHCLETETDPATHAIVINPCSYLTIYKHEADGSWKAIEDISSPAPKPK